MSFGPLKAGEAAELAIALAPGGARQGKEVVPFRIAYRMGAAGDEFDAAPGADAPIVAMELAFPDASRNIAFSFDPPRRIKLDGLRMQFRLPRGKSNQWAVGFCEPNELDEWRKR